MDYQAAGPTIEKFHASKAFVRGLMGPVGSSKSSSCFVDLIGRSMAQEPNAKGIRSTRFAILRNTYPELKSTTIETCTRWLGPDVMQITWGSPIVGKIDKWLPDKTRWKAEFIFLALERPDDADKLGGLEITGGWVNEVREVAKGVVDKLTERVGRFPPKDKKKGEPGPSWRGVVLDTNPPDTDHWYYKIAEKTDSDLLEKTQQAERKLRELGWLEEGQSLYEFYRQPGGLLKLPGGEYVANPSAENIDHLDGGYAYYFRQMANKTDEWIKAQVLGQYAVLIDGKPVYPEYNDELHCREIERVKGKPLILGWDYGLTPAVIIGQLSPRGQLLIHDELCAEDMGIRQFSRDIVKPHLATQWAGYSILGWGDPAGNSRAESDEKTCFMELAEAGMPAMPASTNDFLARREGVAAFLTKLIDGKPAFMIHPRCVNLRKGFLGGYCYKRLQVSGERYKDVADKNKYSHPHDALQYLSLGAKFSDNASFSKPIQYKSKVLT